MDQTEDVPPSGNTATGDDMLKRATDYFASGDLSQAFDHLNAASALGRASGQYRLSHHAHVLIGMHTTSSDVARAAAVEALLDAIRLDDHRLVLRSLSRVMQSILVDEGEYALLYHDVRIRAIELISAIAQSDGDC